MKNFIEKLQKSNEATKKKWLIILTVLAMIVVIGFWLAYLNLTIPKMPTKEVAMQTDQQKSGFFTIFKAGVDSVFSQIKERTKNAFNFFKEKAETERDVYVEKKSQNFILEEEATSTATSTGN